MPSLEITEVVLVHCNIVSNNYEQKSRVLYTFALKKPFVFNTFVLNELDILPKYLIFSKTFTSKFLYIEV